METYLRSKQYYEDRYDQMTVEDCRRTENFFIRTDDGDENDLQEKLKACVREVGWEIKKVHLTLDWYNKRESTINDWMRKDEARDLMLATAIPPKNIYCSTCDSNLYEDSRTTWDRGENEEVLFFMRCSVGHLPMKCIFSDGIELIIKDKLCPECSAIVTSERLPSKKDIIKTKFSCTACSYEEVDEFTLSNHEEIEDPNYATDHARFCLTGESLKNAQDEAFRMERMSRLVEGWKHDEEHQAEYKAVSELEKLTIPQVKQRISDLIEGKNYLNLVFEKPSIERYVSLEFNVEEMKTDNQRMSTSNLQKLLKNALADTNWRLMTEGISYRLGLLTGRIRAYETKEDLLKLMAKK